VAGLCKYGNKYSCIIVVARNFLTNRTTGSSSRRTLLQEVKQPTYTYLFVINFTDGLRSYEDCVSQLCSTPKDELHHLYSGMNNIGD